MIETENFWNIETCVAPKNTSNRYQIILILNIIKLTNVLWYIIYVSYVFNIFLPKTLTFWYIVGVSAYWNYSKTSLFTDWIMIMMNHFCRTFSKLASVKIRVTYSVGNERFICSWSLTSDRKMNFKLIIMIYAIRVSDLMTDDSSINDLDK